MLGERLSGLVSFVALKQAAALLLLSPYTPLLFMGEEYGETAPFQFFTSHSDPDLIRGVQRGRAEEFAAFAWKGEVPDPQAESTFERSRLQPELREQAGHRDLRAFYQRLIGLRRSVAALRHLSKEHIEVVAFETENILLVRRWHEGDQALLVLRFERRGEIDHQDDGTVAMSLPIPPGVWGKELDAMDVQWNGSGAVLPPVIDTGQTQSVAVPVGACALYRLL
jgi:maltooligosyltrehalose trehalohydrolase